MTRYALVIGITQYDGSLGNLTKPAHDAEAVARVLEEYGDFQEVKRLPSRWNKERNCYEVGEKPLKGEDLGQTLQKFIFEQAEGKDAVIYFSGHGFTVSDNLGKKKGYLATSDCKRNTIATCGIALDSLNQLIAESQLSSLVVLLDCCHAGSLLESNLVRQTLTAFNSQKDYYLIAACRAFESAWEGEKYSVFTEALLKGLTPDNAGSDGQVSCDRVFDFIATQLKGSGQEPIRMGWGRAITLVKYPPKTKTVVVDETCPYQGLQAFTKEQARFFFGRDKVVHLLIEKLAQGNFIPIIGASGSGKSSVVRAGLIPELEKNGWRVLEPIKPDVEPLAELRTAFKPYFSQSKELYEFIHHHPDGLNAIMERLPGNERFLLVVDQFEEVFTLCPKEDDKSRFIELLTGCRGKALSCPYPRLSIVITLRADFIEPCLQYESLTQLIQDEAVYMPPLVGADLEKAITNPAHNQGYKFEDGLLGEIIPDVGKEQGSLPLLQFALTELWERDKKKHQLTREQYHQLGGVTGALNRHADKIYNYKDFKLDKPQQEREHQEQELIQRIFLKLVRTGEGDKDTRQRQAKAKLLDIGDDKVINDVLDELIQGRLLVAGQEKEHQEAWVDLAHEALMEGWERFVAWRQENRELRRLIDRVEDALKIWQEEPRDENLMPKGLLAKVRDKWQELELYLDTTAKDFYQRSEVYETEEAAKLDDLRKQLQELQIKVEQYEIMATSNSSVSQDIQIIQSQIKQDTMALETLQATEGIKGEKLVELNQRVSGYLKSIERFEQRMRACRLAEEWLNNNRKNIVKASADYAALHGLADSQDKAQQFQRDIDDYIDWVCFSLNLGKPIPLDEVEIAPVLTPSAYAAAFNFINRELVSKTLADNVAEELEAYIEYLIDYFSSSYTQQYE